jgi:hypothetical protein
MRKGVFIYSKGNHMVSPTTHAFIMILLPRARPRAEPSQIAKCFTTWIPSSKMKLFLE